MRVLLVLCAVVFAGYYILIAEPKFSPQAEFVACESNLRNVGTALQMYSTDWNDHYPPDLHKLTPTYLKSVPCCETSFNETYSASYRVGPEAPYNKGGLADYFFIACEGPGHQRAGQVKNYPQYSSDLGLIESPNSQ